MCCGSMCRCPWRPEKLDPIKVSKGGSVCCRRAELPRGSTILGKKELAHFNYAPEVARVSVGATA